VSSDNPASELQRSSELVSNQCGPESIAPTKPFTVVGIGASAGGLEAVSELLSSLPADSGMAFILVQHLDPHHDSMLVEILTKKTAIPIHQATEGLAIEPNHLYVIPPNTSMRITEGHLTLRPRGQTLGPPMPVDDLLTSLAQDQGPNAIAVILSGSGSDGALAMQTIKGQGGLTFAQDDASARFTGMPRAAIGLGSVDFVLSPQEIGRELVRLGRHPYLAARPPAMNLVSEPDNEHSFKRVFNLLKSGCDVDFTHYRRGTIMRRLARRMAVHKSDTIGDYLALLQATPGEAQALCQDLLIGVTEFFRDPEVFEALAHTVFPRLLEGRSSKTPLRVWVPGCASGEEVYSIAICLLECLDKRASSTQIQIFGSDVNGAAIETARAGLYIENIARDVSEERLRRFFVPIDNRYRVAKPVRDLCIFARHDVTRDPPFSRIDLVSCRNLLIYLDSVLQKRVIPLFHYALNAEGVLLLGRSETVRAFSDLFGPVDEKRLKIYAKKHSPVRRQLDLLGDHPAPWVPAPKAIAGTASEDAKSAEDLLRRSADRIILARYTPAGVLCDDELNVLEFRGDTAAFLVHAPGSPSLNLYKMVRAELLAELSAAIREARTDAVPMRRTGLRIEAQGRARDVNLEVIPVRPTPAERGGFLIFFEETSRPADPVEIAPEGLTGSLWARLSGRAPAGAKSARQSELERELAQLTRELAATRAHMRAIIEEYESAKEELQSAQEELLSSNEEFQSTNEELETAKEELQSTNEELTTTNDELRQRNAELNEANEDLRQARDYASAIVETVREPLLVLDGELRVLHANQAFYGAFKTTRTATENCLLYELGAEGDRNWSIPALRQQLDQILPGNVTFSGFEVTHDFPRIGSKTMQLNARRLAWGERALILLAMEDVTERLAVAEALKQADRRKDEFLAMLAHELRGPLAPIRNALELWRGGNANEAVLRHAQEIMDRQLRKEARLVDDLLDMSRITSGAIVLEQKPVDLTLIARQAAESTRHHFDQRGHELVLDLPGDAVIVLGDAMRLEQVVSNLLNNAAKYTQPAGRITLALNRHGPEAVLTITDNGIGIASELLAVIFDLFTQAERSIDRSQGGLGIGLALVRRLTELHGGTVTAASPGVTHGSTFTLRLPLATRFNKEPAAAPAVPAGAPPAPRRILVVDDNADAAESLAVLLQLDGHEVETAADGQAALVIAQSLRPQVVLLDIGLPGMDGFEVARRLRTLPEAKGALLIALTGYGRAEDQQRSSDAGFDQHMVKPLDLGRLNALMANSGDDNSAAITPSSVD
jgi:two-component system, chemotaxis family, CheB/CheR fusion protein